MDCDFNGGDMGREQSKGEECGGKCSATPGCTHFSYQDGWCYKKSGTITQNNAFVKKGVMCGIIDGSSPSPSGKYFSILSLLVNKYWS